MSSDPRPDDKELEDFLAGRHPLGRAYREATQQEGAPPQLDDDILAAAREAARQPIPRRRPRWLQPMTFAATLALGVAVLLQLRHEPAVKTPLEASIPAPVSNPEAARPMAAPLPQIPASERRDRAERPAPKAEDEEAAREAPLRRPQVEAGAAVPPTGALSSAPGPAAAGAPAPAPSVDAVPDRAAPPPPPAAEAMESEARRYSAVPAPGSAQKAERELMRSPGEDASPTRKRAQAESAAKASPEPLASPSVDGPLGASAPDEFEPGSPQDWFARIRARLHEDDPNAARALLQDFRKAYPDGALPPDLEALERQWSSDPPD